MGARHIFLQVAIGIAASVCAALIVAEIVERRQAAAGALPQPVAPGETEV